MNRDGAFPRIGSAVMVLCMCASVGATEVNVGFRERVEVDVAEGQTLVQTDTVAQEGDSRLFKTGAGTWQLPFTAFRQKEPFDIGVRDGTLELSQGSLDPAVTKPTALLAKAAFWISAKDDDGNRSSKLVVTNGVSDGASYVARWCDERETNTSAPRMLYGLPDWSYAQYTQVFGIPCTYEVKDGQPSVYFAGYTSGKWMSIRNTAGNLNQIGGIRAIFCVHGAFATYGYLLANAIEDSEPGNSYINPPTANFNGTSAIWTGNNIIPGPSRTGWTYLDGRYIPNPNGTAHPTGFHLLSVMSDRTNGQLGGFFSNRKYQNRQGGDYLNECIAFTNELTAAERQQITRYLMRKWNIQPVVGVPSGKVEIAEGATVRMAVDADESTPSLTLAGSGSFIKTGSGAYSIESAAAGFRGDIRVEDGSLTTRRAFETCDYRLTGGDTVTVTANFDGTMIATTTGGAADRVVVSGSAGTLKTTAIPDGVKTLSVDSGVLALMAPQGGDIYGALVPGKDPVIRNGDIEELGGTSSATFAQDPNKGWREIGEHGYYWHNKAYDFKNGQYLTTGNNRFIDIQGNEVLVYNTITFDRDGFYELSFDTCAREKYAIYFNTVLFGPSTSDLTPIARYMSQNMNDGSSAFIRTVYRLPYVTAGTYVFGIRTNTLDPGNPGVAGGTLLDNFKASWVSATARPDVWEIPNGDFERVVSMIRDGTGAARIAVDNTLDDWTLDNGGLASAQDQDPFVTPLVHGMLMRQTSYAYYNTWNAEKGQVQLFFVSTGGVARTTFRPPAGTWKLRGDIASSHIYWGNGTIAAKYEWNLENSYLQAKVSIGGETTDLGSCYGYRAPMASKTWPNAFTVDGETDVTLELRIPQNLTNAHRMSLTADNFELVAVQPSGELVRDGGFEACTQSSWNTPVNSAYWRNAQNNVGQTYSYTQPQNHAANRTQIGSTTCEGNLCTIVVGTGSIEQNVTVTEVGTYRLSFWTSSRVEPNFGFNPLKVSLFPVDGSEAAPTWNGYFPVNTTNYAERVACFRIPAPGTYTLRFQGQTTAVRSDRMARLDAVSLMRTNNFAAETPSIPETTAISVAAGAKLRLDFPGTNRIDRLSLGGRSYSGLVTAARCPDFITGPGALEIPPKSTVLIFR